MNQITKETRPPEIAEKTVREIKTIGVLQLHKGEVIWSKIITARKEEKKDE